MLKSLLIFLLAFNYIFFALCSDERSGIKRRRSTEEYHEEEADDDHFNAEGIFQNSFLNSFDAKYTTSDTRYPNVNVENPRYILQGNGLSNLHYSYGKRANIANEIQKTVDEGSTFTTSTRDDYTLFAQPMHHIAATDDIAQVFSKIAVLVKESEELSNALAEDPLYLQMQAKFGALLDDENPSLFVTLLRLLESLQALIYKQDVTVPAPIFKIRYKVRGIVTSAFAHMLLPLLENKFTFYSLFTLQQKRYIVDAILKGKCNQSILLKEPNSMFKNLCINFVQKSIDLMSIIKPYQELPMRKCSLSQFVPLKELAVGGFGTVYLCAYTPRKDDADSEIRYVAVKVMKKNNQDPKKQSREVKFLIQNSHHIHPDHGSYLMSCLCTFQSPNYVFVAMELMTGGDLIDNLKMLSEEQTRKYAAQIFLAISDLHERGIVHHDLKPENIAIDSFDNARLLDYGLSKMIGDRQINYKSKACPFYPPEMIEPSKEFYGKEIDWYGFGATLYECFIKTEIPEGVRDSAYYQNLKACVEECEISPEAKSLVLSLLNPDKTERLMDPRRIQEHTWFATTDWMQLRQDAPKILSSPANSCSYSSMKPLVSLGPFSDIARFDPRYLKKDDFHHARFGKPPATKIIK